MKPNEDLKCVHVATWPYMRTLLPADLDDSARACKALQRCRNVPDAEGLIRMALAYAVSDLSLKDVAAWACALKIATITGPGLFYRLREAESWLAHVLGQVLNRQVSANCPVGLRIRIVDATVVNGPRPDGTQWRAHTSVDPATGTFHSVEITDATGGEGLQRFADIVKAGDVVLGDRAYGTARGIHAIREAGADLLVRINPRIIRICDTDRKVIALHEFAAKIPEVGGIEKEVLIPIPPTKRTRSHKSWPLETAIAWQPMRLIGARTRDRGIIWLLTSLPSSRASIPQVLDLYRIRWQIELFFKRLKSLLGLDCLPSREGPTAKSWILARLLAAALTQELAACKGGFSPWGYRPIRA